MVRQLSPSLIHSQDTQSSVDEDTLMQAVIRFNRSRLLGRLRSRHAPSSRKVIRNGKRKPQPITRLAECLNLLQKRAGISVARWKEFRGMANALNATFKELEDLTTAKTRSTAGDRILKLLLQAVDQMVHRFDLTETRPQPVEHGLFKPIGFLLD